MARKNRIVVPDGIYHIVTRIAGKAFLLSDGGLKDLVVEWLHGIAEFSGVELYGFAIMDNHLHVFCRVPPVPERYWKKEAGTVPPESAKAPCAEAFGMRPRECRSPRWSPDLSDAPFTITPAGDTIGEKAIAASVADDTPAVILPRPETGFGMSDEEMLERLKRLYASFSDAPDSIGKLWEHLRKLGRDVAVEERKERFCRRMYNISQFAKSLKERISSYLNAKTGRCGVLWEGRFRSSLVENERKALVMTSAYVAYNPVKAGIVRNAAQYRWSSWALACGEGPRAERYRRVYEKLFGCPWDEARSRMESLFAERMPERYRGLSEEEILDEMKREAECGEEGELACETEGLAATRGLTAGQAIKLSLKAFDRGAYISFSGDFGKRMRRLLPRRFPSEGDWSLARMRIFGGAARIAA